MSSYSHPLRVSAKKEYAIGVRGSEVTLLTIDTTGLYATASSAMHLSGAKGTMQSLFATVTLAQINAGKTLLNGVSGSTITPVNFRLFVNGTAGGSGNFILEDTNGTPVVIVTVAEAQLSGLILPDTATITLGAGFLAPLTAGAGIKVPASASITTLTSVTVSLDYFLS